MPFTVAFRDLSTPGPSGPITAWAWNFGDGGTSTSENPIHAFSTAGNHSVVLTVTGAGSDGTATITMPVTVVDFGALTAAFSVSISGLAVTFTDLSTPGPSGPITGWSWNFGDGNTSSSQNPTHTYLSSSAFSVSLTVTGTAPDGTSNTSQTVSAVTTPPAFISATNWSRPSFTPLRTVNFSNLPQLNNAIADMTAGDLIQYNGTGVLNISSSTTFPFSLNNKNPSSTVVIDWGTSRSIWNPGSVSGNYVKFDYTGTGQFASFKLSACSKIRLYGGDLTASNVGLGGVGFWAASHNILWYDLAIHNIGGSGVGVLGNTTNGSVSECYDLDIRAEVDRFAMRPSFDTHADKGTGEHACILHGSNGNIYGTAPGSCRFVIYGHDPLRPGESSAGQTWPEGSGGSVIELGNDVGTNYTNCIYYALGVNMLMKPNGTNPGSSGTQTGGNVINIWGNEDVRTNVIGWCEGQNCTGAVVHGAAGKWHGFGTPSITVLHGRHTNTNQFVGSGGNISDPYDSRWGISYADCV